jgi:hypothetical protein
MTYYYMTVQIVMRDCESETDAKRQCVKLLPCQPDETTKYMESWEITDVRSNNNVGV